MGAAFHSLQFLQWQNPAPTGSPVTSSLTAPQKHRPSNVCCSRLMSPPSPHGADDVARRGYSDSAPEFQPSGAARASRPGRVVSAERNEMYDDQLITRWYEHARAAVP